MWLADIYCDLDWVRERQGNLGASRLALRGMRSESLEIEIEMRLYGDDHVFRHLRVLLHTDDHQAAETCVNLNIQTWVAALETAVMLHTGRTFTIAHFPGTLSFPVTLGVGDDNSSAVFMAVAEQTSAPIDYKTLALGIGAWPLDLQHHLFYFRRLIDERFPLDVRWLNGYRLLEWHFCGGDSDLSKSQKWRAFLQRFERELAPLLRPRQTAWGLNGGGAGTCRTCGPRRSARVRASA